MPAAKLWQVPYRPWRTLRSMPQWDLVWARLPVEVSGFTDWGHHTITLDTDQLQVERRCTLAHELVHAERGPAPAGRWWQAREERTVDLVAAAQSEGDFQSGISAPTFPEVVGYAEIAALAGVSRQRARQFAQISDFPKPVIVTAQGPLMAASAVKRWLTHRNTRQA